MFKPEYIRKISLDYSSYSKFNVKRTVKILVPIFIWFALILTFGESGKTRNLNPESPVFISSLITVLLIMVGVVMFFYLLLKATSFEKKFAIVCPSCSEEIKPFELKLTITTDRCPKCGKTIVNPSLASN